MSQNVKEISGETLKAMIAEGKTVVCDFWAAWCNPCRMLAPVLDALASEFSDRAEFVKVNIDESAETAMELGIMSIPDVYIFDGGKAVTHSVGYSPEEELRQFLEENI